jgi:RHS repeat-associated protein
MLGTAGAIAAGYTTDAFGNLTKTVGSLVNSFRYTGREWDSETGLYYYRARYYDPQAGRFVSEDPIRFGGGDNFYSYVVNRPTEFGDPGGNSQGDVAKLQGYFQNLINQMTQDGLRTDPGLWNNFASFFGGPYLGCADQTQVLNNQYYSDVPRLELDDIWNFQTHYSLWGAHTYAVLQSGNPTDPDIYVDPLKNIVPPVQKETK